jgi:hypothetical protein
MPQDATDGRWTFKLHPTVGAPVTRYSGRSGHSPTPLVEHRAVGIQTPTATPLKVGSVRSHLFIETVTAFDPWLRQEPPVYRNRHGI